MWSSIHHIKLVTIGLNKVINLNYNMKLEALSQFDGCTVVQLFARCQPKVRDDYEKVGNILIFICYVVLIIYKL